MGKNNIPRDNFFFFVSLELDKLSLLNTFFDSKRNEAKRKQRTHSHMCRRLCTGHGGRRRPRTSNTACTAQVTASEEL